MRSRRDIEIDKQMLGDAVAQARRGGVEQRDIDRVVEQELGLRDDLSFLCAAIRVDGLSQARRRALNRPGPGQGPFHVTRDGAVER